MENQLRTRLSKKTPKWFRDIIRIGLSLTGIGVGLLTAESQVPGFVLPVFLEATAQWFIVAGLIATLVAKTAQDNE